MSHLPSTLNFFWLWREISYKLGISNKAYKYWTNTRSLKFNNKYIFLQVVYD